MITVSTDNTTFKQAYLNAFRALPIESMESPRQYGQRWREAYRCRIEPNSGPWPHTTYIFDRDEDYTMFILKWSS